MSESLEVQNQNVWYGPEGDLLGGILLALFAVRAEPGVLTIQLGEVH